MALLPTTYYPLPTHRGQAALALVLIIGGTIVTVSLTLAILTTSFVNSAYGFSVSERAEAVASSGAADALVRLLRNKDFSSPGGYSVNVGSDSAWVTVSNGSPIAGEVTIISKATASTRQRTTTVIAARSSTSSLITVVSRIQS